MTRISRKWCEQIAEMASWCYSEGVGPDYSDMLRWIFDRHPDLKEQYSYMPEAKEVKTGGVMDAAEPKGNPKHGLFE